MDYIAHGVAKRWTRLSDFHFHLAGFPSGLVGKESACNAGDPGLISGLGRSPGEGNQYSCLEAPLLWPPDAKGRIIGKDPDAGKD